jgi:AraC-like DNA-binding protein
MTEIFDDIRGIYDFYQPCEPLRPYIEFFSESNRQRTATKAAAQPFTVEMFPSWTPTFWINLGVPYQLATASNSEAPSAARCRLIPQGLDILVLRDTGMTRYNHPSDHIFTVKFLPGGLESVLGINQTKFIGRVGALPDILPVPLLHAIRTSTSTRARLTLLEDYFLTTLAHRPVKDHYAKLVRESIGLYEDASMLPNTNQLAERLFTSSRTINRYFHRVIGLSPKKYLSIARARAALTTYLAAHPNFSPEAFGFYDDSHFRKSIRQFTGRPLAQLP